jgi:hypothetical protein
VRHTFTTASMWKSGLSAVGLAGLTSLSVLFAAESAAAKPMTRCQTKFSYCSERCIMQYDGDKISACLTRTCNHQYQACARDSGEDNDPNHDREGQSRPKGGKGGRRLASPPERHDGIRLPRGGLLDNGGGLSSQGPSATGSPVSAPAAPAAPPPVIIR